MTHVDINSEHQIEPLEITSRHIRTSNKLKYIIFPCNLHGICETNSSSFQNNMHFQDPFLSSCRLPAWNRLPYIIYCNASKES